MKIEIYPTPNEMGIHASKRIARGLKRAIRKQGYARLLLSTGASQFPMFDALIHEDVDWSAVEMFHLDEYIGLPVTHKASFRKYLNERFVSRVNLRAAYLIDGEGDIAALAAELKSTLTERPIDVGVVGIGENGHIAFNDPPADFDTDEAYITVRLDDRCKAQQVGEGWFENKAAVPDSALSMTVKQIMKCKTIISVVPHAVKADAIYNTFMSPVTNTVPATILKTHSDWSLFLDSASASRIINI
ncbi:MAG: 6-phosphogluconolactonase [Eubacteriales bacterium]|jgi:glucosamine-6-phosphate deaminase|nr:6-phosphogluconolactonase [Eubacteriales bacterium]